MFEKGETFEFAVNENGESIPEEEALRLLQAVDAHPCWADKDPVLMWTSIYVYFVTRGDFDAHDWGRISRDKESIPPQSDEDEPSGGRIPGHIYFRTHVCYDLSFVRSVPRDPESTKAEVLDGHYGRDDWDDDGFRLQLRNASIF